MGNPTLRHAARGNKHERGKTKKVKNCKKPYKFIRLSAGFKLKLQKDPVFRSILRRVKRKDL